MNKQYPKMVRHFFDGLCPRKYLLEPVEETATGKVAYIVDDGKVFFRYRPFSDAWGGHDIDFADNGTFQGFDDFKEFILRQEKSQSIQDKDGFIHLRIEDKDKVGFI